MASGNIETEVRERLLEYVREHHPTPRGQPDWSEDLTNQALVQVLGADRSLRGEALFEAARRALPRIASTALTNLMRRGGAVADGKTEPATSALPDQQSRMELPHTPKGLVPFFWADGRVEYAPYQVDYPPDPETCAMAKLLERRLVGPVLRGERISGEQREAMPFAFRGAFQCQIGEVWAQLLVSEIENAKRDKTASDATRVRRTQLAWAAAHERSEREPPAHPERTTLAGNRVNDSGEVVRTRIEIENEFATIKGNRCNVAWWLPGEPEAVMVHAEFVDAADSESCDVTALARRALDAAKRNLAELSGTLAMPEYADDVELTEWSMGRMGFGGGGGKGRTIKAETLVDLYLDPKELADTVEARALSILSPKAPKNSDPVDPSSSKNPARGARRRSAPIRGTGGRER